MLYQHCPHITLNFLYRYIVLFCIALYCIVLHCTIYLDVLLCTVCDTAPKRIPCTPCTWQIKTLILIFYNKSYLQQLLICKGHYSFKYNDTGTIHSFLEEETNNYSTVYCVNVIDLSFQSCDYINQIRQIRITMAFSCRVRDMVMDSIPFTEMNRKISRIYSMICVC